LQHRRSDARDRQCQRTGPTLRSVLVSSDSLKSNPTLQACLEAVEREEKNWYTRRRRGAEILVLSTCTDKSGWCKTKAFGKSRLSRATLRASASPREQFAPQTRRTGTAARQYRVPGIPKLLIGSGHRAESAKAELQALAALETLAESCRVRYCCVSTIARN
jgi:hypothetical protein